MGFWRMRFGSVRICAAPSISSRAAFSFESRWFFAWIQATAPFEFSTRISDFFHRLDHCLGFTLRQDFASGNFFRMVRLIRDNRNCFSDQFFDVTKISTFFCITECNSNTLCPSASCTTNSVHVAFRFIWKFEVDHVTDTIDIDTTSCDVGSNQHTDFSLT